MQILWRNSKRLICRDLEGLIPSFGELYGLMICHWRDQVQFDLFIFDTAAGLSIEFQRSMQLSPVSSYPHFTSTCVIWNNLMSYTSYLKHLYSYPAESHCYCLGL